MNTRAKVAVTPKEAADMYSVSYPTILAAIHAGLIPAKQPKPGGRISVRLDDVDAWHASLPNVVDP